MTINLFDIPAATSAYIDNEVEVEVTRVTAHLEPDEEGTFTVRVTNASEPNGVRLTDIVLHVTASPRSVALLKPPGSALLLPRATADTSDPRLSTNDEVEAMFVFFAASGGDIEPNATLDVGEAMELEFEYVAKGAGNATISCHVHASVVPEDLFPRSAGANGSHDVKVLAGP